MTKSESIEKQYSKAVQRFEEILSKEKTDIIRDSAIQRFEFTFDLAWKVVKDKLESEFGVICASPKKCFREAYKQGIIEYDNIWIDITNWRNEAIHTYSEKMADNLYTKFPQALERFKELEKKITNTRV